MMNYQKKQDKISNKDRFKLLINIPYKKNNPNKLIYQVN